MVRFTIGKEDDNLVAFPACRNAVDLRLRLLHSVIRSRAAACCKAVHLAFQRRGICREITDNACTSREGYDGNSTLQVLRFRGRILLRGCLNKSIHRALQRLQSRRATTHVLAHTLGHVQHQHDIGRRSGLLDGTCDIGLQRDCSRSIVIQRQCLIRIQSIVTGCTRVGDLVLRRGTAAGYIPVRPGKDAWCQRQRHHERQETDNPLLQRLHASSSLLSQLTLPDMIAIPCIQIMATCQKFPPIPRRGIFLLCSQKYARKRRTYVQLI